MKTFEQQNYYELLEIPVTAPEPEVRAAYERALDQYAPDSIVVYSLDPQMVDALRERLQEAARVLTDPGLRAEYNRRLGAPGAGEAPPSPVPPPVAETAVEEPRAAVEELDEPPVIEGELVSEEPSAPEPTPSPRPGTATVTTTASFQPSYASYALPYVWRAPEAQQGVAVSSITLPVQTLTPPPLPAPVATSPAPPAPQQSVEAPREPAPAVEPVVAVPAPAAEPVAAVPAPVAQPVPPAVPPEPTPPPAEELAPPAVASEEPVRVAPPPVETPRPPPLPVRPPSPQIRAEPAEPAAPPRPPAPPEGEEASPVAARTRDSRETPRYKPADISADAEFNGELLRRVREGRGLSLQALADRTRISIRHLENVEADRYKDLPASVYLRGMLMSVARELGLDPLRVSKSYLALAAGSPRRR